MKAIHPSLFLFNYTINTWRTKTNTFSPCKMKESLKETDHRKLDWTVLNTDSSSTYHTLYDAKKKTRKDFRERNVIDYDHTNDISRKYFLPTERMQLLHTHLMHRRFYTMLLVRLRTRNVIAVNKTKDKKAGTYFLNSSFLLVGKHY